MWKSRLLSICHIWSSHAFKLLSKHNLSQVLILNFVELQEKQFLNHISLLVVCGVRGRNQKIVGGAETLPNEYPWVAGLFKQNKLYCGATIVTPNYLLTVEWCDSNSFHPVDSRSFFFSYLPGGTLCQFIRTLWNSGEYWIPSSVTQCVNWISPLGFRWWPQHLKGLHGNKKNQADYRARRLRHLHFQQRCGASGVGIPCVL